MSPDVAKIVNRASMYAAVLGAVLSPVPLADELILLPMYASLARKVGKAHGLKITAIPWRPIMSTAATGLAARAVVNLSVSFIPGVAAVANAISAAALTQVVGRQANEACSDPPNARAWGADKIRGLLRKKPDVAPV